VLSRTNITKARLTRVYVEKIDWFISADEALEYKIINKILG
jgi:hypothetical protein